MRLIALSLACGLAATVAAARAETPLERGRMLVEGVVACGTCHSPLDATGTPLPGRALAGRLVEDIPAFRAVAPNITPDAATGIGSWTDAQLAKAIREGIRPDGTLIGPPMPFAFYRGLGDADLAAIIAYLRSLPAVAQAHERSTYRIPLPPAYGPPVASVTAPPEADRVATGAYLAGPLGHCLDCHTPMLEGGERDMTKRGAGGQVFEGPWGQSVAANITPTHLGAWSDAEIERAIRTGVSRDGRRLSPPMGFAYYANITPAQMAALIAYLRSLPPA